MPSQVDVTSQVRFGDVDGESLPMEKCICGKVWDAWTFVLDIYADSPSVCENCGRKFFFHNDIKIFQVVDEKSS